MKLQDLGEFARGFVEGRERAFEARRYEFIRLEAESLLSGQRALLDEVQEVMNGAAEDSPLRPALDACAQRLLRQRESLRLRQRADAIYNAYYTSGGLEEMLLGLDDFIRFDAPEIEDVQTLRMKVDADRLRPLRFRFERLCQSLDALAPSDEPPFPLNEAALAPAGWTPVEDDIRRTIGALEAIADATTADGDLDRQLRSASVDCEVNAARVRQNLAALHTVPEEVPLPEPHREETLLQALRDTLMGEAADALQTDAPLETYRANATAFADLARQNLLLPWQREE